MEKSDVRAILTEIRLREHRAGEYDAFWLHGAASAQRREADHWMQVLLDYISELEKGAVRGRSGSAQG